VFIGGQNSNHKIFLNYVTFPVNHRCGRQTDRQRERKVEAKDNIEQKENTMMC